MTSTKTAALKLGFAGLIFTFMPAANCDGGDRDQGDGACPAGETCSTGAPDGLVFVAPLIGEGFLDVGEMKPMAEGGVEHVTIEEDTAAGPAPMTLPFVAAIDGDAGTVTGTDGVVVTMTGAATPSLVNTSYLKISDLEGNLYDRIAVSTHAVASVALTRTFNEAEAGSGAGSGSDAGALMLFGPGGLGYVELRSAPDANATVSVALVDEGARLTGTGITQTAWDAFTVGTLPAGAHTLTVTSNGHAYDASFEVATAPDRVAVSIGNGESLVAGEPSLVCFAAFVGERYMHVGWTVTATNAAVTPAQYEACWNVSATTAGSVAVHATAGGLSTDALFTAQAASHAAHREAPASLAGSPGERAASR